MPIGHTEITKNFVDKYGKNLYEDVTIVLDSIVAKYGLRPAVYYVVNMYLKNMEFSSFENKIRACMCRYINNKIKIKEKLDSLCEDQDVDYSKEKQEICYFKEVEPKKIKILPLPINQEPPRIKIIIEKEKKEKKEKVSEIIGMLNEIKS